LLKKKASQVHAVEGNRRLVCRLKGGNEFAQNGGVVGQKWSP